MSGASRVLVVGSYPPVVTPGTPTTVDEVRRVIAHGDEPIVVSPRTSAADYDISVAGLFAGRRLDHLRAATGASRLVLCVERDLPITTAARVSVALPVLQYLTVAALLRSAAAFEHVTIVRTGDLGVPERIWAQLTVAPAEVRFRTPGPGAPGVTVLGPDREDAEAVVRRVGARVVRRVLGPREPAVRRLAGRARRAARQAGSRGR